MYHDVLVCVIIYSNSVSSSHYAYVAVSRLFTYPIRIWEMKSMNNNNNNNNNNPNDGNVIVITIIITIIATIITIIIMKTLMAARVM